MNSDHERYGALQEAQERAWEETCVACGACCGAVDGDPCEFLSTSRDRKCFCRIYAHRFGVHKTISGKELLCVPLRNILHKSWPGDFGCSYKRTPDPLNPD